MYPFWFDAYYVNFEDYLEAEGKSRAQCHYVYYCGERYSNHVIFLDKAGLYGPFYYTQTCNPAISSTCDIISVLFSSNKPNELAVFKYQNNTIMKVIIRGQFEVEQYEIVVGGNVKMFNPFYVHGDYLLSFILFHREDPAISLLNLHEIENYKLQKEQTVQACENDKGTCENVEVQNVSATSLASWQNAGILKWILGNAGQSCDQVCHDFGMVCDTSNGRFPRLDINDGKNMFPINGYYSEEPIFDANGFYVGLYEKFSTCDEFKEAVTVFPYLSHNDGCTMKFPTDTPYPYYPSCGHSPYFPAEGRKVCPCGNYTNLQVKFEEELSFIELSVYLQEHVKQANSGIVDMHIDENFRFFIQFSNKVGAGTWNVFSVDTMQVFKHFAISSFTSCNKGSQPNSSALQCIGRHPLFTVSSTSGVHFHQSVQYSDSFEILLNESVAEREYLIETRDTFGFFSVIFTKIPAISDVKVVLSAPGRIFSDGYGRPLKEKVVVDSETHGNLHFVCVSSYITLRVENLNSVLNAQIAFNITQFTDVAACKGAANVLCVECPDYTFKDWDGSGNCVKCQTGAYAESKRLLNKFHCICLPHKALTSDENGVYGCTGCPDNARVSFLDSMPNNQVLHGCEQCPHLKHASLTNPTRCICKDEGVDVNLLDSDCNYDYEKQYKCTPGTFSETGKKPCFPCALGFFSQIDAATTCDSCGPGMTTLYENATFCVFCNNMKQGRKCDNNTNVLQNLPYNLSVSEFMTMSKRDNGVAIEDPNMF